MHVRSETSTAGLAARCLRQDPVSGRDRRSRDQLLPHASRRQKESKPPLRREAFRAVNVSVPSRFTGVCPRAPGLVLPAWIGFGEDTMQLSVVKAVRDY